MNLKIIVIYFSFDEIGDLIKTVENIAERVDAGYENTKTLQEYIASLEARVAALEGNTAAK